MQASRLVEAFNEKIYIIRGQKVILDFDLAKLYKVRTSHLNQQVKRNKVRFPSDFRFQLTPLEYENWRLQFGSKKSERGGRRFMPHVFTELGVSMLSTVLNNERAIQLNLAIVRTFVQMRNIVPPEECLSVKIAQLKRDIRQNAEALRLLEGRANDNHSITATTKSSSKVHKSESVPRKKRAKSNNS